MERYNLSLTKLDEIQNHEDFHVVWLSMDDIPNSITNFADYLMKCDTRENCIKQIEMFKSERKILLVLTMDLEYLSSFEDLTQIQAIYLLQKQGENFQFNKQDHPKLIALFQDINDLIDRLRKDILLTYRSDLPINISSLNENNIEQSLTGLHGNSLALLWNQYFIYYLIRYPDKNMKKLMLDQCRFEYKNNKNELSKIADFDENCSKEDILTWYTKDSFLYRLLNKAFRTRNVDSICRFQYFLIHLHEKFRELSKQPREEYPLTVYRGQIINHNDLNRLKSNVGRFISMNTIISTSRREDVARSFMLDAANSVLFKIKIQDTANCKFRPFIDISKFSSIPDEEEILFFVGAIFSIDSVRQESNSSTWMVELTLNSLISDHIEAFISDFQKHIDDIKSKHYLFMRTDDFRMIKQYYDMLTKEEFSLNNSPISMIYIYIAFVFSNLGCYEKAIELYKRYLLMSNTSINSPQSKVIHIIIGYLYYHLSEYDHAFIYYGIVLSVLDETNLLTVELYNHIGDVWNDIDNVDRAISCYQQALSISNQNGVFRSDIDQKISNFLLKRQNSIHERHTNNIDEHYRPIINPQNESQLKNYENELNTRDNLTPIQRIDLLYKIGLCWVGTGNYFQALDIFLETEQIIINEGLDNDNNGISTQRIDLSYQIGLCLMKKRDFRQALDRLLDAEQRIIKEPPLWCRFPQLLSTLYDNIAILHFLLDEPLRAIIMWKKSIDAKINFSYN